MRHPFKELAPEYQRRLSMMKITRRAEIDGRAARLCRDEVLAHYLPVADKLKIPVIWMAASFERESGSDFTRSPAQGDRWDRVSTHIPIGLGPYPSWDASAIAAYRIDGIDKLSEPAWTMAYACWKWEAFNGFGPRGHGRVSGYVWSGSNQYDPPKGAGGKYIADVVWSPSAVDQQLGCVPLAMRMIELRPELAIRGGAMPPITDEPIPVTPVPVGVGGGAGFHGTAWIQEALNFLSRDPAQLLIVDGSYGRRTRNAVRAFQTAHGLDADGLCGPLTFAALDIALKVAGH